MSEMKADQQFCSFKIKRPHNFIETENNTIILEEMFYDNIQIPQQQQTSLLDGFNNPSTNP